MISFLAREPLKWCILGCRLSRKGDRIRTGILKDLKGWDLSKVKGHERKGEVMKNKWKETLRSIQIQGATRCWSRKRRENEVRKIREKWSHRNQRKREFQEENCPSMRTENRALDLAMWILVIEGTAVSAERESRNQTNKSSGNNQWKLLVQEVSWRKVKEWRCHLLKGRWFYGREFF